MGHSRSSPAAALLALTLLAAACGGGGSGGDISRTTDVAARISSTELVVGGNRFVLQLLQGDGSPLMTANVHLRFYDLAGDPTFVKSEVSAIPRLPACDVDYATTDETQAGHGVYTTNVVFDRAGRWAVDIGIVASIPAVRKTVRAEFDVLASGSTPPVGALAPRSRNVTIADVRSLSEVDTSDSPTAAMHTSTIAAAIEAGQPVLVLFASPGYCDSALCSLELDVMRKLRPRYAGKMEFIHVEYYRNPGSSAREPAAAVAEWGLKTQPWFFVIDAEGKVSAKFEGATSLSELDQALRRVAP